MTQGHERKPATSSEGARSAFQRRAKCMASSRGSTVEMTSVFLLEEREPIAETLNSA